MAACFGKVEDEDKSVVNTSSELSEPPTDGDDADTVQLCDLEAESNGEKECPCIQLEDVVVKREKQQEEVYDEITGYNEEQLRFFLDCVTSQNKLAVLNNKTNSIAQMLLERETAVLREESGSGEDSPDSSKQLQSRTANKTRHSANGRFLQGRQNSGRFNHSYPALSERGKHNSSSKSSAAARNTAGSLGSLHDLSTATGAHSSSGGGAGGGGRHSSHSTSSYTHGGGGHRRNQHSSSSACGGGSGVGSTGSRQGRAETSGGRQGKRASARARAGGSCGNLSRSSFDTQPPGSRKREKRNRERAPASTSTKEGGSLQNLSKAECSGREDQKRLHKSGSLSQMFSEEPTAAKTKSRRRKASSETQQQQQQRASEERTFAAPADFSTSDEDEPGDNDFDDDDDEEQEIGGSSCLPYQRLISQSSPPPSPIPPETALTSAKDDDTTDGGVETMGCGAGGVTVAPPAPSSSSSELEDVEVEDQRRSVTTITTLATNADIEPCIARLYAAAGTTNEIAAEDEGTELMEVVSHTAHRDIVNSAWLLNGASSTILAAASADVDNPISFFKASDTRRVQENVALNRSRSIESDAFTSNIADIRGNERERLRTQHSDPSQLGKNLKDSNGNIIFAIISSSSTTASAAAATTTTTSSVRSPMSALTSFTNSTFAAAAVGNATFSATAFNSSTFATTIGGSSCSPPRVGAMNDANGSANVSSISSSTRDKLQKIKSRAAKKKARLAEVEVIIDQNTPGYVGDKDLNEILEYIGLDSDSGIADSSTNNAKKKKKQVVVGKKDDKKERREDTSKKEDGNCKNKGELRGDSGSKKDEECKDDHKKEDSGGGGTLTFSSSEKKKKKEERKSSGNSSKNEDVVKKEVIEKELKKNGIVSSSNNTSSSSSNSIVSGNTTKGGNNSTNASPSAASLGDETSKSKDYSFGVKTSPISCDNTSTNITNTTNSRSVKTNVDHHHTNNKAVSSPSSGVSEGHSSKSTLKKTDDKKPPVASSASSASTKRGKKNSKNNQGIRESSSVEDLVSMCRMTDQINVKSEKTTVDDAEVNKKSRKVTPRRSDAVNKENNNNSVKDKSRRAVDDIKVKSSTSGNTNKSNLCGSSNSRKDRRLSSSNSNLSSSGTGKGSEFVRDFYEAGDAFETASPSKNVASQPGEEFEVVSRRKNKNKKASHGASSSMTSNKSRWSDESGVRDGYREYSNNSSNFSNKTNNSKNNSASRFNSNTNNNVTKTSNNNNTAVATSNTGKRKPPMKFEEAPRTPHDVVFMARLAANNVSDRNTATSAPNSDCSDSDGDDSVHSMPTPSTTPRPDIRKAASSSDTTPQASYANIARLAGTANKNQVKRMTSAPHAGSAGGGAGYNGANMSGGSSTNYHSAAATATSDQSLLTTNAWPKIMSSAAGASAANVVNCAATGAATSAPAIPTVVGKSAAVSSGGAASVNKSAQVGGHVAAKPVVSAAACASKSGDSSAGASSAVTVGGSAGSVGSVVQQLQQKFQQQQQHSQIFFTDNFPPLKSNASNTANIRQTLSVDRELGSSYSAPSYISDQTVKQKDISSAKSPSISNDGNKAVAAEIVSHSLDKEPSPVVDESYDLHNGSIINNNYKSSVTASVSHRRSLTRETEASSLKENTPEIDDSLPKERKQSRTTQKVESSINGNNPNPDFTNPIVHSINNSNNTNNTGGKSIPRAAKYRVLQQVSSNINNKMQPLNTTFKKYKSLDLNNHNVDANNTRRSSVTSNSNNVSSNNSMSSKNSNSNNSRRSSNSLVTENNSREQKRKQNEPVVFADTRQLEGLLNSNMNFTFGSVELNADDIGPDVTANNLANANTYVSAGNTSNNVKHASVRSVNNSSRSDSSYTINGSSSSNYSKNNSNKSNNKMYNSNSIQTTGINITADAIVAVDANGNPIVASVVPATTSPVTATSKASTGTKLEKNASSSVVQSNQENVSKSNPLILSNPSTNVTNQEEKNRMNNNTSGTKMLPTSPLGQKQNDLPKKQISSAATSMTLSEDANISGSELDRRNNGGKAMTISSSNKNNSYNSSSSNINSNITALVDSGGVKFSTALVADQNLANKVALSVGATKAAYKSPGDDYISASLVLPPVSELQRTSNYSATVQLLQSNWSKVERALQDNPGHVTVYAPACASLQQPSKQ
uniref:Mucin-19-like n=2 Tax=Hirondellea gigas TaxID=1518452 RepID=A0A6A7FNZ4_9CRUS